MTRMSVRAWSILTLLLAFVFLSGCQSTRLPGDRPSWQAREVVISPDIRLQRLAEGVWLHQTWHQFEQWGRVQSNGLLLVDGDQALLVDTPVTNEQTAELLNWVESEWGARIKIVIPTHWHVDCMGGLAETQQRGATSWAQAQTITIAQQKKLPVPDHGFELFCRIKFASRTLELFYPGPGHALDNIVVWLDKEQILFGGCLIRAISAQGLGNIADGDVNAWPRSVQLVRSRYPQARTIIPGHGSTGSTDLLTHTIKLCQQSGN